MINHRKRFLTGLKPTGEFHLGNYCGAIGPAIALSQNLNNEVLLLCVDWHGLTNRSQVLKPGHLTHKIISTYLALGFNLQKNAILLQSDFKEIQENAWYLGCASGSGLLERAHAYKDALANGKESSCGLLFYPLLMASDIVTFDAEIVPVGKDQLQHIEFASDMVRSFHHVVQKQVYTEPQSKLLEDTAIVVGTDGRKMSKSYQNIIPIFGTEAEIEKSIKDIKTDSKTLDEPKNPDDCLVFQIFSAFASPQATAFMRESLEKGGYGYGHAKKDFWAEHKRIFGGKQKLFEYYYSNPEEVKSLLQDGYERAQQYAQTVTQRARDALGLMSYRN